MEWYENPSMATSYRFKSGQRHHEGLTKKMSTLFSCIHAGLRAFWSENRENGLSVDVQGCIAAKSRKSGISA